MASLSITSCIDDICCGCIGFDAIMHLMEYGSYSCWSYGVELYGQ